MEQKALSVALTVKEWLPRAVGVPEKIPVRLLRFYARSRGRKQRVTLVTTLLDPVAYPAEKLIAL